MKKILLCILVIAFIANNKLAAQLSATLNPTNPTCNQSNGAVTVAPTGGGNYTYKWSTGATGATISNLAAATYTVTVYSSGGGNFTKDTIYREDFEGTPTLTLNVSTGSNGSDNNYWTIDAVESGETPGTCGTKNGSDNTLYITSSAQFVEGAAYDAGGLCGVLTCPETNMAAQSANISTTGAHNLILAYQFMGGGKGVDVASSYYSINGGTSFTLLDASVKSSISGCNNGQTSEGKWAQRTYNLPNTANNINNLKIRFNWSNDDDGDGTDPSIAVNNIYLIDSIVTAGGSDSVVKTITLTPVGSAGPATIAPSAPDTSCAGDSVHLCVSQNFRSYRWNDQNPDSTRQCIYGKAAGNYYVTVTDANGCTAESNHVKLSFYKVQSVSIVVSGDTLSSFNASAYQWYRNGTKIIGATDPVYIITQQGQYEVEITDTKGCKTKSTPVTGITDITRDPGFTIYPNPASANSIKLSINSTCIGCPIEVFDAAGKVVVNTKVSRQMQDIDISTLAKGVYIIKVAGSVQKFIRD